MNIRRHPKALIETFESRILYSADPGPAGLAAAVLGGFEQPGNGTGGAVQQGGSELVFVDSRVPDIQQLLDDLAAQQRAGRAIEIFVVGRDDDGIALISASLAGRHDISAVHVLGHGSAGVAEVGATRLDAESVFLRAGEIAAWGDALSVDADLLLYGCDVAADAGGRSLVSALAQLTGADVAASDDLTGAAALGGDWNLEYTTGSIETAVAPSGFEQQAWSGILAISANGTATSTNTTNTSTTPLSWSHTVAAGSNRVMFVELSISNTGTAATGVTYGGVAMTLVGRSSSGVVPVEIWKLVNPTVGTASVVASFSPTTAAAGGATTYNGVDQTTPVRGSFVSADGVGMTASVTVASAPGDLVIDAQSWQGLPSGGAPGSGQTVTWSQQNASITGGSTSEAGAASVEMSSSFGSSTNWVIGAVSLKAAAGITVTPISGLTVTEGGGAAQFSVVLDSAPTANVTVGLTSSNTREGTLSASSLTFTTANWNVAQTVTVTGVDDTYIDGNTAFSVLTAAATSTDPAYSGLNPADVSLINTDNDTVNTLVVDTTSDTSGANDGTTTSIAALMANKGTDGKISLREAITAANATANGSGGADRIHFAISGTGIHTITLGSLLPDIVDALSIDATTDDSFTAAGSRPAIVLDGGNIVQDGLRLYPGLGGSTIRGLIIQSFTQDGIDIGSSSGNTVAGNWIGLNSAGTGAAGNQQGVNIWNANNNIIGGITAADRNVLSGNTGEGVYIGTDNATSTGNQIRGNYIGLNAAGTAAVGNLNLGVLIESGASNTVGGSSTAYGNVIAGTLNFEGIRLGATASSTTVSANVIGLAADGSTVLGNAAGGVAIYSANNTIGGTTAGARNIISGNASGVIVSGASATGNLIVGNYIGTDSTGLLDRGNTADGVLIEAGASSNTLGGSTAGHRNIISGNNQDGVQVDGETSDNNTVRGNWIGINAAGTATLGNSGDGVYISSGADGTNVGGSTAAEGNWIAAGLEGVEVDGPTAGTNIRNNRIGTDVAGTANWGMQANGILIENSLGGAGPTNIYISSNTVAFSGQSSAYEAGIAVLGTAGANISISANSIYSNVGMGIDLGVAGVTANDAGDADTGPNQLQNFPVLTLAKTNGSDTLTVGGTLNSTASTSFKIEVFSNPTLDAGGYGEGRTSLGTFVVTTNASGDVTFSNPFSVAVAVGQYITATASRYSGGFTFETSEFSRGVAAISSTQASITVDTVSDANDGDTTSLSTLLANKGSDGFVSLREAIIAANNTANGTGGADRIQFSIAGPGPHSISLTSALPLVTQAVIIDGSSEPDFAGTPVIELNGAGVGTSSSGIVLGSGSSGSTVKGLVINRFSLSGIRIEGGSGGNLITGNYLGTDTTGLLDRGNTKWGLDLEASGGNNVIGGGSAALRNVVSGNNLGGVSFNGATVTGNLLQGNYIGAGSDGTTAVGNSGYGGVLVLNGASATIGGVGAGLGNLIAYNTGRGLDVKLSTATILGNAFVGNSTLGIDLGDNGSVEVNDTGDGDTGANNLQNYPVLTSATYGGDRVLIVGTLNSTASTTFRIEFFSSVSGDASAHGEGQVFLGAASVTTDSSGNASFSVQLTGAGMTSSRVVSATATVDLGGGTYGSTSEFSANINSVASGPTVSAPPTQTVAEDGSLVFSSANGNGITVGDGMAGDGRLQVALASPNGTLTLGGTAGLTVVGGANGSASMVLWGTKSALNAALNGLAFTPVGNFNGSASISVTSALAADLAGYYPFSGGSAADQAAGTMQNGTLLGNATVVTDPARGEVLNLDGNGDALQIDSLFGQAPNVTIGGWVNLSALSSGRAEFISLNDRVHLALDDAGGVKGSVQVSAGVWTDLNSNRFLAGTGWHHVMYVFDDANDVHSLYIDGSLSISAANTNTIYYTGATTTYIGRHPTTTPGFDFEGQLDDVRIYDRALTATEVGALAIDFDHATSAIAVTVAAANDAPTFDAADFVAATSIGAGNDRAYATVVQPDGKIVVAGYTHNGSNLDFVLVRYNADGTLDTGFGGGDGIVTQAIGTGDDEAYAVALQADGKILVAGRTVNATFFDFAVLRYTADGLLDTTFGGGDGIVITDFGASSNDTVSAVLVQSDGKIVVGGTSANDFAVARYLSDGTLDTSFSGDGKQTLDIATANDEGRGLALQTDGKIVQAGTGFVGGVQNFALVRYNADGSVDTGFGGGDGIVTTAISTDWNIAQAVEVQSDGKIVVGGYSRGLSDNDFTIVRYTSTGTLDTSFGGGDGIVTTNWGSGDSVWGMSLQSDDKIVVAGGTGSYDLAVARYLSDGSLDTSFSGDGKQTINLKFLEILYAVDVAPDGRIVAAGYTSDGGSQDLVLTRLTSTGELDTRANSGTTSLGGTVSYTENGLAVVLDSNVRIYDTELSTANNFNGATLTLVRSGGASAQDVFSATGNLAALTQGGNLVLSGVTVGTVTTHSAGTLLLTFNASATQARINEVMNSIAYANSSDTPPASVVINWTLNDGNTGAQGTGGALTATGSTTVSITAVNDAPVVTTTGTALAYTENAAATSVDSGLTVSDVDTATLASATVSITAGFVTSQDVLVFTNQNGIAGSWNAGTGVLTLSGSATLANYQTALRSVTYINSSDNPDTTPRTVTFVVSDGSASSTAATRDITVTAVNDAPVLTTTGTVLAYTENTAATTVDSGLTVSDVDTATLASATVSITSGFVTGQDVLAFTDQNGITGSWNAGTGVLTLTGSATLANYQTALRSVTYINSSDNPDTTPRTVTFVVSDGSASSTAAMRDITITAVNDVPVVTTTGSTLAYTENATATAVDSGLTVSDVDTATLASATVSITAGFVSGQDVLAFTNQNGITGSWNAGTGVLTLSGSATLANYQTALRSVTYLNSSDNPDTTPRTVTFVVSDGSASSAAATRGISVTAINDAPVVTTTSSALAYTENAAATVVDSGLTVSDVDTATLASATVSLTAGFVTGQDVLAFTDQNGITGSWNASTGVLTLSGSATLANYQSALRSVTYINTSDNPSAATRTVSFVTSDGSASSAAVTRDITITAVNDAPVVTTSGSVLVYTENDSATAVDSGLTVFDVDTATLASATVSITSGFVTGQDVLAFTDQNGITGSWNAGTGVLTLSGSATLANYQTALRSVTYINTSDNPSAATRTVSFVTSDGSASSSAATRDITITAVNDAPVVTTTGSALAYTENDAATVVDSSLTVSDVDTATLASATVSLTAGFVTGQDVLAFTDQNGITGSWNAGTGVLTLTGSATLANYQTALRSITYVNTSDNPSPTTRTVAFVTSDGSASSAAATRDITITAVNDAPVVTTSGSALAYTENDAATVVDSSLTVSDVDTATLASATVSLTAGFVTGQDVLAFTDQNGITGSWNAGTGVLTLSGSATLANYQTALRSVTYVNTSDNPSPTTRTVSFVTSDGSTSSATTTRDITIAAVNDAPVVTTSGSVLVYTENDSATAVDSGLTVSDVDTATIASATVSITSGFVTGQDVLAFTDQNGITGSWNAGTGVLTLSGSATLANYQTALRSVTYINSSDNPSTAPRTVAFAVNDGSTSSATTTRDITIAAVNDAPVVTTSGSVLVYTENDTATAVDSGLTVSDVDTATIASATVSITSGFVTGQDVLAFTDQNGITGSWNAGTGVLTLSGSATLANYQTALRSVTYLNSSDNPSTATRTVSFATSDGSISSAAATRDITVTAINDAPVFTGLDGAPTYTSGRDPVVLDADVQVFDAELSQANFDGVTLLLQRSGGANGQDVFSATGTLSFSGGTVSVGATAIGSVTTNSAGTLRLTFNADATNALVNSALQQIAYSNSGSQAGSVQIDWTLSDGNSGAQGAGGALGAGGSVSVSLLSPPGITVSAISGATTEAGGTASFTVVLDALPTGDVTIAVSSSNPQEGTVSTSLLSFTAANWSVAQTVTITGIDDTVVDGNRAYTVVLGAASSTDTLYNGFNPADVAVTNNDNDTHSTIVVTTASDAADAIDGDTSSLYALLQNKGSDGLISLREAIIAANNSTNGSGGADRILFGIAGTGEHLINLAAALPAITDAVILDASTDDSFAANGNKPALVLDGNNLTAAGLELTASADGSTIRGLVIRDFDGSGIVVQAGSDGNTIAGNYIGRLNPAGDDAGASEANTQYGVYIAGANNTVGGPAAADGNLISGNLLNGVHLAGAAATGNTIQGNRIGTNAAGSAAIGNQQDGIYVQLGAASTAVVDNLIAGNVDDGIEIVDASSGNLIRGNTIGLGADGSQVIGNGDNGIVFYNGVSGSMIGGTTPAERNVISGNTGSAIVIDGAGGATTTGNTVAGNLIGTDSTGLLDRGNGATGVVLKSGAAATTVGGSIAGAGNVIAGNLTGILIDGETTDASVIQGNRIGVGLDGTTAIGNTGDGVRIANGADDTLIGGTTAAAGNIIANHTGSGINIASADSTGNAMLGNRISASGALGIDLGNDGISSNDTGDADTGANNRQNAPVLTSALTSGTDIILAGTLNSVASTHFRIEFFASASPNLSGYGEGQIYLGSVDVLTDASGDVSFNPTFSVAVPTGHVVSATATRLTSGLDAVETSEFSVSIFTNVPVITSDGGGSTAALLVAENTTPATTVTATDPDGAAQNLSFTLSAGADKARFSIDPSTGVLSFLTAPNYEAPLDANGDNIYEVVVQVADGTGAVDLQAIAVTVTPVNETPPTITSSASASVAENGTTVLTVTASDADRPAATLNYRLAGGADAALFAIDASTGALSFLTAPDYETPLDDGGDNVYNVTVEVTDGDFSSTQALAITVTPVNETPPTITSSASAAVAENTTAVLTVTATDPDRPAASLSYRLAGGADAALFAIDASTGALSFLAAPDYETPLDANGDNVYKVTVEVTDGDFSSTQAIAITVTPVNETTPAITSSASAAVAENTTAVLTLNATDPDRPAASLSYRLAGGADAALFAIDASTGVLSFIAAPDYETPLDANGDNVYNVTVEATDGDFSSTQAIAITVTPVNETPPTITSSATAAVAENTTTVSTVTATDPDRPAASLSYRLAGGADAALFAIDASTGALSFITAPDYETPLDAGGDNVYNVTVEATDGDFSSTQAIAITVTPVNETSPTITSSASAAVAENTTAVLTVTATDPDRPAANLSYRLASGADAALFAIDASTGALSFITAPDYETPLDANGDNVYDVVVSASDGVLTVTQTLAISVENRNEAPQGSDGRVSVAEDGRHVFGLADFGFTDPLDAQANGLGAVQIVAVPGQGSVLLAGVPVADGQWIPAGDILAGLLSYAPAANDNGAAYAALNFRVRDDGGTAGGGVDTEAGLHTLTIDVSAVNDLPVGADDSYSLDEDTPLVVSGPGVLANDVDQDGDPLAAERVAGPAHGSLTLAADGSFRYTPLADWSGTDSFSYRSFDGTGYGAPVTVRLVVQAINDAPLIESAAIEVMQGGSASVGSGSVVVADSDSAAASIRIQIERVTGGHFELRSTPGVTVGEFGYADLAAGQVVFLHDGSATLPVIVLQANDGQASGPALSVRVSFQPSGGILVPVEPPVVVTPSPVVPGPSTPAPAKPSATNPPAGARPVAPPAVDGMSSETSRSDGSMGLAPSAVQAHASGDDVPRVRRHGIGTGMLRFDGAHVTLTLGVGTTGPLMEFLLSGEDTKNGTGASSGGRFASAEKAHIPPLADGAYADVQVVLQAVELSGVALSVGVVWWATRAGGLVASLLMAAPAWRSFDPLPVLGPQDEDESGWGVEVDDEMARDEMGAADVFDAEVGVAR